MNAIFHVRKVRFGVSQAEFGAIAGVSQGTVSKWEADELSPDREEMERIRSEAKAKGLEWDDRWFFEVPQAAE